METLKEYLLSKYFSSFGYVVIILHIPALVTFAAFTGQLRTSERRLFRCDVSDCRDDCLREYDDQFNSPFPLYGFVLLSFSPLVVVSIAYSWCVVKSRVDEIEIAMKPDPENPRPRLRVTTRKVFRSYFVHLLLRFVLGILFIVLQNFVFYVAGYPTEFVCRLCNVPATVKSTGNSTHFNETKADSSAVNCDNSVGSDFALWAKGIWIVNALFAVLVFGETCYLLVQGRSNTAFTFDSEFCLKHFFNKSRNPVKLRDSIFLLKGRYREETEYLDPLIASFTDSRDNKALDDIFVPLSIHTGRATKKPDYSLQRHEIYDIHLQPQQGSIPINKLEELFLPNKDIQDPRKILIVGRPGIGKSLVGKKLLRDWSKDKMLCYNEKTFQFFFLFEFRHFNSETPNDKEMSLKKLLSRVCTDGPIDNDVFQYILDNPERVLLIFDGLDEFKHHETCLEDEQAAAGNGPTEEMQFASLYVKLVKGKLLSGATVLTTSRPQVVQSLQRLKFEREVEIMGFTPEKVQEYVQKHCAHNTELMSKIWVHIRSNAELLSLCYIPVNCFIICSLLEKWISLEDHNSARTLPKTSTEIFTGALRLFIFKHHPAFKRRPLTKDYLMGKDGFPDSVEKTLNEVRSLAKKGIESRQLVFGSKEVQGMENCGLLHRLPDVEAEPLKFESHFCFLHLTLQELLAAEEITKMPPTDLSNFISSNSSDPKWHLVIQFVAGLLHGKKHEAIDTFVSLLLDTMKEHEPSTKQKTKTLLMLHCLHEHNDEETVKKAAFELERNNHEFNDINLCACQVTSVDCIAITYFVKYLTKPTKMNLSYNHITHQGVSHLCDALKHVNCQITQLNLSNNSITDQGVSHLCDALKHVNCQITQLDLSHNSITDRGVSHLCDALTHVNSQITQLNLGRNMITDQGVSHLCDALKHVNCHITQLNLSDNSITDQGVSHLCDALKYVNCQITQLNLCSNSITDQGVSHLCDALKHVNCQITQLNLRSNSITDQDVSHLCDALKHVNCQITQLNLGGNSITDQGVLHLCDVLKHVNCQITQLNLSYNSITDQGVSHLCDALIHVNSQITQLYVSGNSIRDQGVSHLRDALKHGNCEITRLNLSHIIITDQGVSHLCDALKHVNCQITQLDLSVNGITDQAVSHLCDALKHVNCKITQLTLFLNSITDQGVSQLCDALKHVNCQITELDLSKNRMTYHGKQVLREAQTFNNQCIVLL